MMTNSRIARDRAGLLAAARTAAWHECETNRFIYGIDAALVIGIFDELTKLRRAAALSLPRLIDDRRSLVECCSQLRKDPTSGEIVAVPGTLDPGAEADVAAYDEAIAACREALWEDGI